MTIPFNTAHKILTLQLPADSDFGPVTVQEALLRLSLQVWKEGEEFSGKRPLGNSDWQSQITDAVIAAGLSEDDWREAEQAVADAFGYFINNL